MVKLNENYKNIKQNYLFSNIGKKVREYSEANPDKAKSIIRLGIGDVTEPLSAPVVAALEKASKEMGVKETFHGYGDEQGYGFLREAVAKYYKRNCGVELNADEIFISDGAKSDIGNFTDLFSDENVILIPDPVYPAYMDCNLMNGRKIIFGEGGEANGFLPMPQSGVHADIIYLCSPNNPTGAVYTKSQLKEWVDYANKEGAIIFFDAAYEAFITDDTLPRSIFEIDGARDCAVEFCSLSKTAGFTGTRCGYTVVPQNLVFDDLSLNKMWFRRQTTKYNGTAYIIQRGAEAVFSDEGIAACEQTIKGYLNNAKIISDALDSLGIWYTGGKNSPYIWLKCGMDSWEFFDRLLHRINIVGTPGSGFGKCGEGYFRLTAFNTAEKTKEAVARLTANPDIFKN